MGQDVSTEPCPEENRLDIFKRLPQELRLEVVRWIMAGPCSSDTITSMLDVWTHEIETMRYPKTWNGYEDFDEACVGHDITRTEIRRLQKQWRIPMEASAEQLLKEAAETHLIRFIQCRHTSQNG